MRWASAEDRRDDLDGHDLCDAAVAASNQVEHVTRPNLGMTKNKVC